MEAMNYTEDQEYHGDQERDRIKGDKATGFDKEMEEYERGNRWQPIETAPKDGTPLILFCDDVVGMGQYLLRDWTEWEGWQFMTPVKLQVRAFKPTHWMPLPVPPTPNKEDESCG